MLIKSYLQNDEGVTRDDFDHIYLAHALNKPCSSTGGKYVLNWGEPERAPHKRYTAMRAIYGIIGASLSEPHVDGIVMRELFIGASLSKPHTDRTFMRELFIYIIIINLFFTPQ